MKQIVLLISLMTAPAFAGGMDSGGGGLRSFESNPWFIGNQEVRYCVEASPDFPTASTGPIQKTVQNAFQEWRRFQTGYRLGEKSFNLSFPDGVARGIDLQYIPVDDCKHADITVLIGVTNNQVRKILKNYPPKTYGFAHLLNDYDFKNYTRKNRGIIWIAQPESVNGVYFPPYDKRPILPLVLLHEIGHTLGIGHLGKYSIMSGDIFEWMSVANEDDSIRNVLKSLAYIDNPTPLISFGRTVKWEPLEADQIGIKDLFIELLGRDPVGQPEFLLETVPDNDVGSLMQTGWIQFRDGNGVSKHEIQFHVGSESTWPYCKIKIAWEGVAPTDPTEIRTHGCLDALSSDYLVGKVLDNDGLPISKSKVSIGTRQKFLNAFGGQVRRTTFNIQLRMVGAID